MSNEPTPTPPLQGRFRKKPVVIKASQWLKNGDHPEDHHPRGVGDLQRYEEYVVDVEGAVVRRYRHPEVPGASLCEQCGKPHHVHGWIDTLEQGHRVCPGDWIITGIKGERYPCKPDIFAATYEPADAIEAAQRQPPAGVEHQCWLIEANYAPVPLYLTQWKPGKQPGTGLHCDQDANAAIRFPSEESARNFLHRMFGEPPLTAALRAGIAGYRVTEHIFDYTPRLAAPQAAPCRHDWTEESPANGWRSNCRRCELKAQGSGQ